MNFKLIEQKLYKLMGASWVVLAAIITIFLLYGCTYNITLTCGEDNNIEPEVSVEKRTPISASVPLIP